MAKVTFEFEDGEDTYDIDLIVNRNKMAYALEELKSFRREIYKGYIDSREIVNTNTKQIFSKEDFEKNNGYIADSKIYIHDEYILQRLDDILDEVRDILDY